MASTVESHEERLGTEARRLYLVTQRTEGIKAIRGAAHHLRASGQHSADLEIAVAEAIEHIADVLEGDGAFALGTETKLRKLADRMSWLAID